MAFVIFYAVLIVPLALLNKVRNRARTGAIQPYPGVSVLVPAYNEEGYIGPSIESILASTYPSDRLEVIVVDDGSTDGTLAEAAAFRERGVEVFTRENGGKHAALNYGLLCSSHDIVVTIDADSELDPGAISTVVGHLQRHPRAGAIAGTVRIANDHGVLTGAQALEYVLSINTFRRAFDLFGAVPVVPGCLGAYRREALEACYGWDPDTLTEDFDMTLHVLKQGWEVHASDAIVWTEAPTTLRGLYNQRMRWYRGNVMTLLKHRDIFVDSRYGFLHQFVLPLRLLTMVVIPSSSFVIIGSVALALATGHLVELLVMFGFFLLWQATVSLLVLQMEGERLGLVRYSPLFVVGYKHFHDFVTIKSFFDVMVRDDLSWTQVQRARQQEGQRRTGVR
jgi:biofilm PGA synthesis N-glycosyltransferase PgaC